MSNVELFSEEPDVSFDADATGADGIEKGHVAPVVVVGVAGNGEDIPREVGRVVDEPETHVARLTPLRNNIVDAGGEDEDDKAGEECDELDDAAGELKSAVIQPWDVVSKGGEGGTGSLRYSTLKACKSAMSSSVHGAYRLQCPWKGFPTATGAGVSRRGFAIDHPVSLRPFPPPGVDLRISSQERHMIVRTYFQGGRDVEDGVGSERSRRVRRP